MLKNSLLLVFFLIVSTLSNAQLEEKYKNEISDAEYHFLNNQFKEALDIYKDLVKIMPDNSNINYRVGLCYQNLPFENGRSLPYLKKAVKDLTLKYREGSYKETKAPIAALFYLGYSYHLNNKFDDALIYYNRFRDTLSVKDVYNMTMVERQIISVQNAKKVIQSPIDVEISNIGNTINTNFAEYNPAVTKDGKTLIYTRNRPLERLDSTRIYMNELYRDIMITHKQPDGRWSEPTKITNELDTKGKCHTLSVSANGNILLLYRDDWNEGGLFDNTAGSIYISYLDTIKNKWSKIEKLPSPINSNNWETHACITPDGKNLYFSSDRKGGYGGQDIYVAQKDDNGNWGEVSNLGETINTPYDETTPYLLSDGESLFFSSEGHFNMGGLDIFTSKLVKGEWTEPVNIGYPINSTGDDSFFVPIKDGKTAFFAAERYEGYLTFGSMDIYEVQIDPKWDEKTISPDTLALADSSAIADSLAKIAENDASKIADKQNIKEKISKQEVYIIRNIFFDFNSFELNREAQIEAEKLFALMNNNPSLYIEIIGHTDSRGSAEYNQQLSLKRSRAVAEYLQKRGIEKTRFVTTGYGKTRLIAKETEGNIVLKEGQQLNRRVEIKILKTDNEMIVTVAQQIPEKLRLKQYNRFSIVLAETDSKVLMQKFNELGTNYKVITMQTDKGYLYYFGDYISKADAIKDLNYVVSKGYNDAYIIDYFELNQKNKFVTLNRVDGNIKYTIQLKAIDQKVLLDAQIKGVTEHKTKDGFYRYTFKEFSSYEEAEKILDSVINDGFENAFIIESYKIK